MLAISTPSQNQRKAGCPSGAQAEEAAAAGAEVPVSGAAGWPLGPFLALPHLTSDDRT
jgi:hypothetical protein